MTKDTGSAFLEKTQWEAVNGSKCAAAEQRQASMWGELHGDSVTPFKANNKRTFSYVLGYCFLVTFRRGLGDH